MDSDSSSDLNLQLAAWQKAVDVQMHFNDLEMRVRNFYITVMTAIFGAAGFSLTGDYFLHTPFGYRVTVSLPLFLLGWMAACLFYIMDRHWYHRLLVGAVRAAEEIAKQGYDEIAKQGYFVGGCLGAKIREESPIPFGNKWIKWWEKLLIFIRIVDKSGIKIRDGCKYLHSDGKLQIFYKAPIYLCFIFAFCSFVFGSQIHSPNGYQNFWLFICE